MDLKFELIDGGVVESVDTPDLKSDGESHTGSSPVSATKFETKAIEFIQISSKPTSLQHPVAPVWDTTRDEKDFCSCGEGSEILFQGRGYCDDHWYRWLCKDRGYDVSDDDGDERFVATIFV